MKNSGIVRKIDELGRIVIPKEIRKKHGLEEGTEVEIYTKGEDVILKKYKNTFCPECLTRCEHIDNYCRNCGISFNRLGESMNDC